MPRRRRGGNRRATIDTKMEETRERVIKNGTCQTAHSNCVEETGCKNLGNNTYTCLCTHDGEPPTSRGICPIRKTVPHDPGRIPNVQPPSNKQTSQNNTANPKTQESISGTKTTTTALESSHSLNNLVTSIGICTFIVVLIVVVVVVYRRKMLSRHANNSGASPINLKHSLLMADRYAPNPQYSSCSGTGVPLLRKETLKFLNEIGEGCFGKVYKGELLPEGSDQQVEIVAIKVLKENASREAEEDFIREVEIMSAFRHPNILSLLGMVIRDGNATVSPMMVFEYMPHGDLAELLRAQKRPAYEAEVPQLTHRHLLSVAMQIAGGMKYLAAQRFVHRDLACRNCLVAEGATVKIADFGMSRDVYTCDYYKIGGSRLLPVRWMSPESVLYGRFTLESDIWSYGVLLWEIYSFGKQPYYGHNNEEAVRLILDGIMLIPPEDCPPLICELMKNCWKTEPRDRIKFPNICDKLELAFDEMCKKEQETTRIDIEEQNNEKSNDFLVKTTTASLNNRTNNNKKSLPRPPPLRQISREDLLDSEGYLLANEVRNPVQYLETLPVSSF